MNEVNKKDYILTFETMIRHFVAVSEEDVEDIVQNSMNGKYLDYIAESEVVSDTNLLSVEPADTDDPENTEDDYWDRDSDGYVVAMKGAFSYVK